jgi:hypothetical protein
MYIRLFISIPFTNSNKAPGSTNWNTLIRVLQTLFFPIHYTENVANYIKNLAVQSANCSVKTDDTSSSPKTYLMFGDEDCYHRFHANRTPIEWSWMTQMSRLTLHGTRTFHVKQRSRIRHNSHALGQLFRQDKSIVNITRPIVFKVRQQHLATNKTNRSIN